jgi:hypothetical protein
MRKDSQKSVTVTRRTRRTLAVRVASMRESYVRIYNGGTVVPPTHTAPVAPVEPPTPVVVAPVAEPSHEISIVPVADKFRAVCSTCGELGTKPTGEGHAKGAGTKHLNAVAA